MPIDDMFQDGTDKVLDDRVARPLQAPTVRPSFGRSTWNMVASPFKGAGVGLGLESTAMAFDLANTFGQANLLYDDAGAPGALTGAGNAEVPDQLRTDARKNFRTGEAYSSDVGTSFRMTAREFAPDPATANMAEDILYGLGRFGGKAIGYTMMGGPVFGATMTGLDEGMTESDRLKEEGVDLGTRTKVGVASAVASAAATALPVAGKTLKQTAALVVGGGPVAFIAQQAASKAILENAGYDRIADQYDPFDPVGLAVSTLVPAAFGGMALRGRRIAAAKATRALPDIPLVERSTLRHDDERLDNYAVEAATREGVPPVLLLALKNAGERTNHDSGPTKNGVSSAGADGVMQFIPDTWKAYGKGSPKDPINSIDAGAKYLADLLKQYDGNPRAAFAHYNGGGKAGKAVMEGRAPPAKETQKYLERTDTYIAERQGTEAGKAAAQDPEMVAAARVQQVRQAVEAANPFAPDDLRGAQDHLSTLARASDQLAAGERVDVGAMIDSGRIDVARVQSDLIDRIQRSAIEQGVVIVPDFVTNSNRVSMDTATRMHSDLMADARIPEAVRTRLQDASMNGLAKVENKAFIAAVSTARRAGNMAPENVERIHREMLKPTKPAANDAAAPTPAAPAAKQAVSEIPATKAAKTETATASTASKSPETASGEPTGAPKQPAGTNPLAASLDAQTAEIARLSPDLMVQLEGMESPMRLADAMEAVRAEAAKDVQEAPLLQVAAECFLRSS